MQVLHPLKSRTAPPLNRCCIPLNGFLSKLRFFANKKVPPSGGTFLLTKRRDSKGRPRRSLGKNCPVDIILCESPGLQMSLRASAHTGVAIRFQSLPLWGGTSRSESKSNNCQWQLLHNAEVARAFPASARRMRAKTFTYPPRLIKNFWHWFLRRQFSCPGKKIDKKPA